MNRRFGFLLATASLIFPPFTMMHAQTLARLANESAPDISRSTNSVKYDSHSRSAAPSAQLRESASARFAARALFVESNLDRARSLARRALARDSQDAEALFVRMEVAAMQADDTAMLQAATELCELGVNVRRDARVGLAAARLREAAGNTADFRGIIPRLQALLANSTEAWPDLQDALLRAAMDGAPGLDPYSLSRSAGILTQWRIVGPLGLHPLLDQQPISPSDDLSKDSYQSRRVENFAFPDGRIVLPDYLSGRGVFYAAAVFSSLTSGSWTVQVDSAGPLEVFADSRRILQAKGRGRTSAAVDLIPGPHRVLLKFIGSAAPLRISIVPTIDASPATLPRKASLEEMTYLLAAEDYAAGQFATAAEQIENVPSSANAAALQFLLGQSRMKAAPTMSNTFTMWDSAHSWCKTLLSTVSLDRARGQLDAARVAQKKLDGCAPESLDYAQSLSDDGNHGEAARALQRLLAAAPLNRATRQMLVAELQLSGDDVGAQRAAAEWLRIAPNAEDYRRLAAYSVGSSEEPDSQQTSSVQEFYLPYRRDAAAIARQNPDSTTTGDWLVLLDDHVAIARPDGSVSLYVHRTTRALTRGAAAQLVTAKLAPEAQVLGLRIIHPDGSTAALSDVAASVQPTLSPGDAIDEEYILNYIGDGGIPEHAEAFQFVFGSFDEKVMYSRFVVLTPAGRADRGVVISSGDAPAMTANIRSGMVARVWEKKPSSDAPAAFVLRSGTGLAIVRVVEDGHGWSEPSSAEHRHKIETIHPGPRPSDS